MTAMTIVYALAVVGLVTVWLLPVIIIWCIKPNKSIQDGLRDWLDEQ